MEDTRVGQPPVPDESLHNVAEQGGWVYDHAVLEIKKEILKESLT
jgi:hypothetical protein